MLFLLSAGPAMRAWPTPEPIRHVTWCDHGATIVKATMPDYADVARDLGLGRVVALIEVRVDARGRIQRLGIYKGVGNAMVDRAAIRVARQSIFGPAKERCRDVPGTVIFPVDFNPGG